MCKDQKRTGAIRGIWSNLPEIPLIRKGIRQAIQDQPHEIESRKQSPGINLWFLQMSFFEVRKLKTRRPKGHGVKLWKPFRSYYYIHAINRKRGIVRVRNKQGVVLNASYQRHSTHITSWIEVFQNIRGNIRATKLSRILGGECLLNASDPISCVRKWGGKWHIILIII